MFERPYGPPKPGPLSREIAAEAARVMAEQDRIDRVTASPPVMLHDGASGILLTADVDQEATLLGGRQFSRRVTKHRTRVLPPQIYPFRFERGVRVVFPGSTGRLGGSPYRVEWNNATRDTEGFFDALTADRVTIPPDGSGIYGVAGKMDVEALYNHETTVALGALTGETQITLATSLGPPELPITVTVKSTSAGDLSVDLLTDMGGGTYETNTLPGDIPFGSPASWDPGATFTAEVGTVPFSIPIDTCFREAIPFPFQWESTGSGLAAGAELFMDLSGDYVNVSNIEMNLYFR